MSAAPPPAAEIVPRSRLAAGLVAADRRGQRHISHETALSGRTGSLVGYLGRGRARRSPGARRTASARATARPGPPRRAAHHRRRGAAARPGQKPSIGRASRSPARRATRPRASWQAERASPSESWALAICRLSSTRRLGRNRQPVRLESAEATGICSACPTRPTPRRNRRAARLSPRSSGRTSCDAPSRPASGRSRATSASRTRRCVPRCGPPAGPTCRLTPAGGAWRPPRRLRPRRPARSP
jgi:hypothetical protein